MENSGDESELEPPVKINRLAASTSTDARARPISISNCSSNQVFMPLSNVELCVNAARAYKMSGGFRSFRANSLSLYQAVKKCFNINSQIPEPLLAMVAHYVLDQITDGMLKNTLLRIIGHHKYEAESLIIIFRYALECSATCTFKDILFDKIVDSVNKMNSTIHVNSMPFVIWMTKYNTNNYPELFPGVFYFPNSDNDDTKMIELSFANPDHTNLKHQMSSGSLYSKIYDAFTNQIRQQRGQVYNRNEKELIFSLTNNAPFVTENPPSLKPLRDLCKPIMTYCSVNIPEEEIKGLETAFGPWGPHLYLRENRYGPVVVKFRNKCLSQADCPRYNYFKLGTKTYWYEHSQIILAGLSSYPEYGLVTHEETTTTGINLEKIQNISEFKWELKFCSTKCWTHPEIAFVGGVDINLCTDDCKITFEDHQCVGKVICEDCKLCLGPITVKKIVDEDSKNASVIQLDVTKYGSTLNTDFGPKITCSAGFALFKFASSCPKRLRSLIKSSPFANIFEDFHHIERIWEEECPDFHYTEWKNTRRSL